MNRKLTFKANSRKTNRTSLIKTKIPTISLIDEDSHEMAYGSTFVKQEIKLGDRMTSVESINHEFEIKSETDDENDIVWIENGGSDSFSTNMENRECLISNASHRNESCEQDFNKCVVATLQCIKNEDSTQTTKELLHDTKALCNLTTSQLNYECIIKDEVGDEEIIEVTDMEGIEQNDLEDNLQEVVIPKIAPMQRKCEIGYISFNSLAYKTKNKSNIIYRCSFCEYECRKQETLMKHVGIHHSLICYDCGYYCSGPDELKKHKEDEHTKKCTFCGFVTNKNGILDTHISENHSSHVENMFISYECNECKYQTAQLADLNLHKYEKHTSTSSQKVGGADFESAFFGFLKRQGSNKISKKNVSRLDQFS